MNSSVLFQSDDKTVVLLDLPRSIEECQCEPVLLEPLVAATAEPSKCRQATRRLISTEPPEVPFSTPEPKRPRHDLPSAAAQVAQVMTRSAVDHALDELRRHHAAGPWLLPRCTLQHKSTSPLVSSAHGASDRKRKSSASSVDDKGDDDAGEASCHVDDAGKDEYFLPPGSHYILGAIEATREAFVESAPLFNLIVLDPPWPNKSAKRKKESYNLASRTTDIRELLSQIPVAGHLAPDGFVAVWVTNKPAFMELLTSPSSGLLDAWGLELVGEWAWLKVTARGEPLYPVGSDFRKPWEPLLVARRKGSSRALPPHWDRRVLVSVPDVHSRKPNLRVVFQELLPTAFRGLEVFARNLTAGWWSWGDDVLRFQHRHHWAGLCEDQREEAGSVEVSWSSKS